ncbi:YqaA family protein [Brevibacillus ginsengisoli]|uniref:YqaA family protein n=1 Tax=Brevibacillus ginsengisoli TaxID=363854 RepID=UPI003CF15659
MFEQITQIFMQYGAFGLFSMAFLDSFVLPVPPFFMQIAMSLLDPSKSFQYATYAFLGSILGAPVGFLLGKFLGKRFLDLILPQKWVDVATEKFTQNGDAAILIGSFTPIPFKVFTILSGAFGFSFFRLMMYAILGRGLKFYLIGVLFYFYGKHAKEILDNYQGMALFGITVLLVITWYVVQKRKRK